MPLIKIKVFNALIDNKQFFDQPVKNKQEGYEKHVDMSRNYDYRKRNLLDYSNHENYYKLTGIDISSQKNTSIPQQINFIGKLEKHNGATILYIAGKEQKTILNFFIDL